jgi:uncharacterized lipoprotein YddW (UPF0748 family)
VINLYGLTAQITQFAGLSPRAIGETLRQIGGDGVFLKELRADWVEALQSAGLRVYASQGIFVDTADLWQRFPDSRPITADGEPAPQEDWYRPLRPTHREIRALRLEQLETLAANLPLDGIWLDFIRWPARWEKADLRLYDSSFDDDTLAQFAEESQIDLPAGSPAARAQWILSQALPQWIAWRCTVIERFVIDAAEAVRRHRPDAVIGLFTIPWTGNASADQTNMAAANHRIVAQDLTRLGHHVDVISPMVYHRLCGRPVEWIETVARHAAAQTTASLWPVIEAIDPPEAYTAAEFGAALHRAQIAGSGDTIIFKLDGILSDPDKQTIISTIRKG